MIRTLIVDDEPLARERIRGFLEAEDDVQIVGEAANGEQAVRAIRARTPDLVFLDIQMPGLDGFGVVDAIGTDAMPNVVFCTAYDEYAIRAFDVHALDYLLKPFDRERFQAALDRARDALKQKKERVLSERLAALISDNKHGADGPIERLAVKSGGRILFVRVEDISWVEAAGNYVRLHTANGEHLLRETMGGLENKLDPRRFLRIHRSTIVNLDAVQELQPWFHGEYAVILKDGSRLTMSRGYRDRFQDLFA